MWKPVVCLLIIAILGVTVTVVKAGRTRVSPQNFYNFRPELEDEEELVSVQDEYSGFGLKTAASSLVDSTIAASQAYEDTTENDSDDGSYRGNAYNGSSEEEQKSEGRKLRASSSSAYAEASSGSHGGHSHNGHSSGGHGNGDKKKNPFDASYSFGFDLEDQSRHETSDPNGNVNGFYSFIDDQGTLRRVTYTAGANKGFVVLNKEKQKGHSSNSLSSSSSSSNSGSSSHSVGGGKKPLHLHTHTTKPTVIISSTAATYPSSPSPANPNYEDDDGNVYPGRPWGALAIQNNRHKGGKGRKKKPIFVVKIRRPVKKQSSRVYIKHQPGDELQFTSASKYYPSPPRHRSTTSSYDNDDDDSWTESTNHNNNGASKGDKPQDASYAFAYDTDTSNRKEVADPWGNVRGSYSYIDPHGLRRTVNYIAGAASGYKLLGTSPTVVESVYEDSPTFIVRRPLPVPVATIQQPSAIVYHIHPDGAWRPWEGKVSTHRKRPRPHSETNSVQFRPSKDVDGDADADEGKGKVLVQTHPPPAVVTTRKPPPPRPGQRGFTADEHSLHLHSEEYDATLSVPNYEALRIGSTQENKKRQSNPPESNLREYKFGDKNSHLMMSESQTSPVVRTVPTEEPDVAIGTTTEMSEPASTIASTQVEKPEKKIVGDETEDSTELSSLATTTIPPPLLSRTSPTASSVSAASRRSRMSSTSPDESPTLRRKKSNRPSQTAMRMTREQTTKATITEVMSNSGRLMRIEQP